MATETIVVDGRTPPYLTFPRFEGFIASFKGKTLPPRFDRSLVRSMSGAEQSNLNIALRFFRLVEGDDRRFTHTMQQLVGSHGTEAWKGVLRNLIAGAYSSIVGDLDKAATRGQLGEAFRDKGGLKGSARDKAIRFYLTAARAADIELSEHFSGPAAPPSANGETPKRSRKPREKDVEAIERQPEGTTKLRYTVPSGDIQVWLPEGVRLRELDVFASYLKQYIALSGDDDTE